MFEQIVIKTQNYCLAIREQLGYPLHAPVNPTLAFASGGPAVGHKPVDLARHATAMQRDFVYTAWIEFSRPEPNDIVLALRELGHVEVVTGCHLWAANAEASLVIVAPKRGEQFVLGARGYLERRPGLPVAQLGRGRRLARRRVRQAADAREAALLPDNQMVAPGADWVAPAAQAQPSDSASTGPTPDPSRVRPSAMDAPA